MSGVLRVGIAGYGVVGQRRRRFIDEHPRMRTAGVCDRKFAGAGVLADGVRHFTHYRELLDLPLDVLFVSLPNYLAAEVTIAGLEKGLHVFCEKPPGRDLADIRAVREVERRHPAQVLKYGFNHRYHDSVEDALRIVRSGELGEVVSLRGVYGKSKVIPFSGDWRADREQAGGGILLDQGIHMVDLIRLFGGEFREVKSFVSSGYWKHDVEDNAYALLRHADGARIAMLHSSATQWQHRFSLDVTLREGALALHGILSGTKSYGQEQLEVCRRQEEVRGRNAQQVFTYYEDNSWRDEILEMAACVLEGVPLRHGSSRDALETMKLVYRIYHADPDWRRRHGIADPDAVQDPA